MIYLFLSRTDMRDVFWSRWKEPLSKAYLREFKSNGPMIFHSSINNSGGSPSRPGDFPFCIELNTSLSSKREWHFKAFCIIVSQWWHFKFRQIQFKGSQVRSKIRCIEMSIKFCKSIVYFTLVTGDGSRWCLDWTNSGKGFILSNLIIHKLHLDSMKMLVICF